MATADVVIGTQHGDDCTCRKLDPFEVSITPVIVNCHCPGQDERPCTDDVTGRITITWPRPHAGLYATPGAPLVCSGIRVCDAETGEEFVDGVRLTLDLGTPTNWTPAQPIFAEVTRVVADDRLAQSHAFPCDVVTGETADDARCSDCEITLGQYEAWRTDGGISCRTFRYEVAEMRIAPAGPGAEVSTEVLEETVGVLEAFVNHVQSSDSYPTKDGCGDELTIDCLHHAITCVRQAAA
jgi:hypothetical protein